MAAVDSQAESPATVPHLVRARELSTLLDVSESAIYSMAAAGEIPSIRIGRRSIRFDADAVMAALREGAPA